MRVLFLSHRYADTCIGGLAEFLHHLPTALKAHNIDSIIYTRAKKNGNNHLTHPETLTTGFSHYSGPFLKPQFFITKKNLQPLITLCAQEKIDVIHAQGTYRAGYMAMHVKQQTGIPYIITSHSDISEINSARIQRFNIRNRCKKILANADHVTHLTPRMAEISHRICPTQNKSTIIHNGIDLADWQAFSAMNEQDYVLAIGRLETEKGFPILIDAYLKLMKQGFKTSLVIAGAGSAEKQLQTQAKNAGISVITDFNHQQPFPAASIIFTGYVRAQTKKQLFAQAKLILFATQPEAFEEAFGIVQIEAMAAGKALVASDIATTRYLQTLGLNAKLVTPNNPHDWSSAISTLLQDQTQRLALGAMNKKAAAAFDWQKIAEEYAHIYRLIKPTA